MTPTELDEARRAYLASGGTVTLGKAKGAVVVTNTDAMLILIEPYRIDIPLLENAKVLIAKVKA